MTREYFITITNESLEYQCIDYLEDYIDRNKLKKKLTSGEILTCLFWLLCQSIKQKKGLLVRITEQSLEIFFIANPAETFILCLEALKSLKMIEFNGRNEFYSYLRYVYAYYHN